MPTDTKDEYQIVNDFIQKVMKKSWRCNHCALCYFPGTDETFCFFGYDCLTDDFSHFDDGD